MSDIETSYPSKPVIMIDVPETKQASAEFVYNFFTSDERVNDDGVSIDVLASTEDELTFLNLNRNVPRYNKISWRPTILGDTADIPSGFANIAALAAKINSEEDLIGQNFASVRIQDTQTDTKFYLLLSASTTFVNESSLDSSSLSAAATELAISTISTTLTQESSIKAVIDSLSNIQPEGYSTSGGIDLSETNSEFLSGIKDTILNFSLSNLIIADAFRTSTEDPFNVFQDEMISGNRKAQSIQRKAVLSADPGIITSDGFEISISSHLALAMSSVLSSNLSTSSAFTTNTSTTDPITTVSVGYIIEKTEILASGEFKRFDDIIVEHRNVGSYVDASIKYGGVYRYKIRTVYYTTFEAIATDPSGRVDDQVETIQCLISSGGKSATVIAVENTPPNPPADLKFRYNFENNSLYLLWSFPPEPQRDVKYFQVFRRKTINEPFRLLAEYDFDDSLVRANSLETIPKTLITRMRSPLTLFADKSFERDSQFIYAIACVDAHGLTSNYSSQYQVSFDRFKNKIKVKHISQPGAPKPYPNLYLEKDLFVDTMKDSGHQQIRIYFDPEYIDVTDKHNETLGLIKTDQTLPTYKLQIINVDLQTSQIVDVGIRNKMRRSLSNRRITPSRISAEGIRIVTST